MRWSEAFIPTLREDPADAEAASHRLLLRGGFVRQLMAGSYSLLPLGMRVAAKIERIIREEMDGIGGQEFLLPVIHPGELWKRTGRWDDVEGILVKFRDRRDADLLLAMSHEEVFTLLATEMSSYRQLPQMWYHLQTKFRDEPRPKGGLLRVREFTMKDSYTFDIDPEGLDLQFSNHYQAYDRIFKRFGMDAVPVEASSGVMGGTESIEFTVRSEAGEDDIAICSNGDYAANVERASSVPDPVEDDDWQGDPEQFATPGITTIAQLAGAHDFAPADRQIKTLAYVIDGSLSLILLRGDHELIAQKLIDGLATQDVGPAGADQIRDALGAGPGSLGAVGVSDLTVIADPALRGRTNLVTGANEDGYHLRGVAIDRDIKIDRWLDVRLARAGERCPRCDGELEIQRRIEVGHIFKLGTKYSDALGAYVLDETGQERIIHMGSYGIGVGRTMAAIIEANHDDAGIIWPMSVAPYEVVITALGGADAGTAAEKIYQGLAGKEVDVILDDRQERPGVKFNDADLIGFALRVTVGSKGLAEGTVELKRRRENEAFSVALPDAVDVITEDVTALRN